MVPTFELKKLIEDQMQSDRYKNIPEDIKSVINEKLNLHNKTVRTFYEIDQHLITLCIEYEKQELNSILNFICIHIVNTKHLNLSGDHNATKI